jgi:hypothetical protein
MIYAHWPLVEQLLGEMMRRWIDRHGHDNIKLSVLTQKGSWRRDSCCEPFSDLW